MDSYLEWTHKYLPELSRKILSSLDGVVEKDGFFYQNNEPIEFTLVTFLGVLF